MASAVKNEVEKAFKAEEGANNISKQLKDILPL
jgi:hypothetical protein